MNHLPARTAFERKLVQQAERGEVVLFRGKTCFLSHFFYCKINHNNDVYCSAEQAYQWFKAIFFDDLESAKSIVL